jgi:thioredoxin reductase (NADPH)
VSERAGACRAIGPGVLAAGDIRAGSVKRVGFVVGDGSLAVARAHQLVSINR